jgi:hypothetical protein
MNGRSRRLDDDMDPVVVAIAEPIKWDGGSSVTGDLYDATPVDRGCHHVNLRGSGRLLTMAYG